MPRRTMFGYEDILKGSYAVLEREGLPSVTAVSVASEVGCSTMPIFWIFRTINDLRNETIKAALEYLVNEIRKPRGNNIIGDAAMAMCILGRDKPNLFKALFFEQHQSGKLMTVFHKWLRERARKSPMYAPSAISSEEKFQEIMNGMFTLAFGYASQIVLGGVKSLKDEMIFKNLMDLFTPYYAEHVSHKGKGLPSADDLRKMVQKHVAEKKADKTEDAAPLFPQTHKQPAKKAEKAAPAKAKTAPVKKAPAKKAPAKKAPAKKAPAKKAPAKKAPAKKVHAKKAPAKVAHAGKKAKAARSTKK